jgi:hypothetical protein
MNNIIGTKDDDNIKLNKSLLPFTTRRTSDKTVEKLTLWSKNPTFWDITPCSPLKVNRPEAVHVCSSEASVEFQGNTRRHISRDRILHNHQCENLKAYNITVILEVTSSNLENRYISEILSFRTLSIVLALKKQTKRNMTFRKLDQ